MLFSLAFEPYGYWLFAPVSWAFFLYTLKQVTVGYKFFNGFLFAFSFWVIHINWLTVIGLPVLVITAFSLSLFYGVFASSTHLFSKSKLWPFGYAFTFLTLEVLLTYWPMGGFNWGSLGYISASHPFTGLVEVIGSFGLSIFIILFSVSLIYAFELATSKGVLAGIILVTTWGLLPGFLFIWVEENVNPAKMGEISIAVVQGNVPRLGLDFNEQRKAVYQNHVTETLRLINNSSDQNFDLIVWPENAPDVDPFANLEVINELNTLSQLANAPILIGSRMQSEIGPINASILITGNTTKSNAFIYAKQKLVPFGEKIPAEEFLGPIAAGFGPIGESLTAGSKAGILSISQASVGLMICFEVAWGQIAKNVVEQGANVLLVQTNNATYGLTNQLSQQFNIAKIRSIESQKELITVATSGISGHLDQAGEVKWVAQEFTADSEILEVSLYEGVNIGVLMNHYLQLLIVIFWVLLLSWSVFNSKMRKYVN